MQAGYTSQKSCTVTQQIPHHPPEATSSHPRSLGQITSGHPLGILLHEFLQTSMRKRGLGGWGVSVTLKYAGGIGYIRSGTMCADFRLQGQVSGCVCFFLYMPACLLSSATLRIVRATCKFAVGTKSSPREFLNSHMQLPCRGV